MICSPDSEKFFNQDDYGDDNNGGDWNPPNVHDIKDIHLVHLLLYKVYNSSDGNVVIMVVIGIPQMFMIST